MNAFQACQRDDSEEAQIVEKPATKRLKSRKAPDAANDGALSLSEMPNISDFCLPAVRATPAIHKHGPGPSKPLPVTLGVSGGGFGEKVPSLAKVVWNSVKSIGMLIVDKDFGDFVEIDKSYWSKAVAPFMGEQVSVLFMCLC